MTDLKPCFNGLLIRRAIYTCCNYYIISAMNLLDSKESVTCAEVIATIILFLRNHEKLTLRRKILAF